MTSAQKEARIERKAIMAAEGVSEEEAEAFCDSQPWAYGYSEKTEKQERLI